jgi:TM2 domain-containing membrane protein YozV
MKSRTKAILLALFLGGIGAHKFYQNKIFSGVLYLIFSWATIPSIIAFIEFIYYLTLTDEQYEAKFVK